MAWCYPATFDLKESFRVCVVSPLSPKEGSRDPLILYAHRVFSPSLSLPDYYLDCCHDCYLKVFTRDKHWLFTLLLSFQRAKRRLTVNALIGGIYSLSCLRNC